MTMPIDLSGPTYCLITGASQGIGRALAVELSKLVGPNSLMLLLARNSDELSKTAELCQSANLKVVFESIDLSKAKLEDMSNVIKKSLFGRQVEDFAKCVVIHNVGSLGDMSLSADQIENVDCLRSYFDLNVFNVIGLNTRFLEVFKPVEDRIVIVNITSLCAIQAMSGMAFYCSGKAAREMYFKVLSEEKKNIRILNYAPGPVETAMIDYIIDKTVDKELKTNFVSYQEKGQLLKPEVTAKKCMKILQSGKFTPGQHFDYFDEE